MDNKALGKGLSALIPEKAVSAKAEGILQVKLDIIKANSLQPRKEYSEEKLSDLISSIKEKGVLQPILVRERDGGYEVIAGERRLRAARFLNMTEIPVIVKNVSDQEALVLALVENIQREELNCIEEAQAFKQLIEGFGYDQEAVAKAVGKDRSTISNTLRLLKLSLEIQGSVAQGKISEGHARALLSIEDEREQKIIFDYVVQKGISVRALEEICRTGLPGTPRRGKTKTATRDHHLMHLEEDLRRALGTKVKIVAQRKKGKIIIEYYSNLELDRIIHVIKR